MLNLIFQMMNKQLTQQQNLEELMRLTLINILNAKGVIYTYYKQQQEREQCKQYTNAQDIAIMI